MCCWMNPCGVRSLIVRNVLAELRQPVVLDLLIEPHARVAVADGYVLAQWIFRPRGLAAELAQNPVVIASYLGA